MPSFQKGIPPFLLYDIVSKHCKPTPDGAVRETHGAPPLQPLLLRSITGVTMSKP